MWFGIDPEVCVVDKDGKPVSAHSIGIPPKWEKRLVTKFGSEVGSYFRDNYGAEINIKPSGCRETVIDNTARVVKAIRKAAAEAGCSLSSAASVTIDPVKELSDAPPDVREWGCNPSYDAYSLVAKRPEMDPMTVPVRTFGGHVHLATDNVESTREAYPWTHPNEAILLKQENYPDIIKLLDAYLGTRATLVFDDASQFQRRKIYGQAGEFRPQVYGQNPNGYIAPQVTRSDAVGVEYRTPPPAIFNTFDTVTYFLGIARYVVFNFPTLHAKFEKQMETYVQEAINEGKNVAAVVKQFPLPSTFGGMPALMSLKAKCQDLIIDKSI